MLKSSRIAMLSIVTHLGVYLAYVERILDSTEADKLW